MIPQWFCEITFLNQNLLFCPQDPPTWQFCCCLWPFCIWSRWPCFSLPPWRRLVVMHFCERCLTHSYWNKEAYLPNEQMHRVQRSCMFIYQNVFRIVGWIILPNIYQVKLKHFYLHFFPMVFFLNKIFILHFCLIIHFYYCVLLLFFCSGLKLLYLKKLYKCSLFVAFYFCIMIMIFF